MKKLRCSMSLVETMVMLGISQWAGAAAPGPVALARCAAIVAPDARLACYDALTNGRRTAPAAPAAPSVAASSAGATPLPAAPAPSAGSPSTPASAAPTLPTPTPASVPTNDPRNFGLTDVQMHKDKAPSGPAAIQARIAKIVNTRYGGNYVVLDNGQTWAYADTDEDSRLSPGDQVTIKRASLGSFLMNTPSRRSYHMRRTE